MARGQLRVYLGSAPGVGKTYRMLDEGWRRRERGTDVVIGYVEDHDRPLTAAQIRDLEIVPRVTREYRGAQLQEMDLEAVLARKPEVALVDELAHTNVPGGTHEKRWQDVETLLDAGIDVITTVNIQHLESVNDVVEKITGVHQNETVPDAVVRRAEQIEVVDITPEALRRRMAHGNIYKADRIDASLANYFRVGNLSALRELALLWLADRVEDALQRYQDENEINKTWETRERLVVGVSGAPADEILLRRAARIASRTGAEMIAVHVVNSEASARANVDLTQVRSLVEEFEGRFQEIVDDNVAIALVAFAHSERGTQILLGSSHRYRPWRPLAGIVESVLRHATDLDVHVIAIDRTQPDHVRPRRQRRTASLKREAEALALGVVAMPLLTVALAAMRSSLSLSTEFLCYLIVVLAVATWGGAVLGLVAAVAAAALENFYFVPPIHTFSVSSFNDVIALVAYLLFGLGASAIMRHLSRRSYEAERARAEAKVLAEATTRLGTSHDDLRPLLDSLRAVLDATSVAIYTKQGERWDLDVVSGAPPRSLATADRFEIDPDYSLVIEGASLEGDDRQLVTAFTRRIASGLRIVGNAQYAERLRAIVESEADRRGLLSAAADELREPLGAIEHYVDSLLDGTSTAPARVQRERLESIEASVRHLSKVAEHLAEASRLDAGTVTPRWRMASLAEVVDAAVKGVDLAARRLDVEPVEGLASFRTDPDILARALSLVLSSVGRESPEGQPVRVSGAIASERVELLVIGRGAPAKARRNRTGVPNEVRAEGLALHVASGLLAVLGGRLRYEDTPGGGITVVIEVPLDATSHPPAVGEDLEVQDAVEPIAPLSSGPGEAASAGADQAHGTASDVGS